MSADAEALERLVRATPWLLEALRAARSPGLASWCIGAGAIRTLVWDALHGRASSGPSADVDLVFHDGDPARAGASYERALEARLCQMAPGLAWDVVNQAGAHHAFPQALAQGRPAHASLEAAIATWPETATCVGVFLDDGDALHVIAPLGLRDLFDGVVRFNPACGDRAVFDDRLARKRWRARWPALRVVEPRHGV